MIWLKYIVPSLLWTCCNSQNVCEEPPETDFGETVSDKKVEYRNGDTVQYRCFPGYALEGPEWITCKGLEWTPAPKCLVPCTIKKQQLEAKNLFLSGGRRYSLAVQNNQTLEFLCGEGYVLSAPSIRRCIDGHMNLPSCISERGKNCSRSPTIENGDITTLSQEQYTSGSSVEFKCQRYYAMEGPRISFCDNGNWTEVPVCLEIICESGNIMNGYITSLKDIYKEGDELQFDCRSGYKPVDRSVAVCSENGWNTRLECIEVVCSRPEVNNGNVSPHRQQYSYQEAIQIECDPGYEPQQRQATSSCTKTGWNPQPKCVSKRCNYPEAEHIVVHGYSRRYKDYYFPIREGGYIDFRCQDGFLPPNNRLWQRSACTKAGWNPEPECFNTACGDPPTVANADIISGRSAVYKPNHQVQYGCHKGFEMSGSDTVTCGIKVWSAPPTCEDVTCPPPNEIDHGEITGQRNERYMPSDTVRYQCDPGWSLFGPVTVKCVRKQWTKLPRCIDAETNCSRPPVIQNGDVLNTFQGHYPPGTTLKYKCQNLYLMNGSAEVHCENGLWTEPPTCIEACTISEEDMARNNIELRWKDAPKLYSASGDVVEFTCRRHYQLAASSPPLRTHCINGQVEYPRCVRGY